MQYPRADLLRSFKKILFLTLFRNTRYAYLPLYVDSVEISNLGILQKAVQPAFLKLLAPKSL